MTIDWTHELRSRPCCGARTSSGWARRGWRRPEAYLNAPMASLVLHVNREALDHPAEVSLLRDLCRATGGAAFQSPG
jgi:hypothetical protein